MVQLFNTFLYEPLFNLLVFLYNIVPGNDIGLAIIILTIIIKIVLFPFSLKSIKSQKALQEIQPKIEELKKKYKDKKEQQAQEMMKLYKEQKVNPLSSCFPLLIQFPFLLAVYRVFRTGLNSESLNLLYSFVENPGHINSVTLGFMDLAKPSAVLAVLAGAAQFWQTRMLSRKKSPKEVKKGSKDENMMAAMNKNMLYFMPILTVIIGMSLPGGLTLYWFLTTLLTVAQQFYLFRKKEKQKNDILPSDGSDASTSNQ